MVPQLVDVRAAARRAVRVAVAQHAHDVALSALALQAVRSDLDALPVDVAAAKVGVSDHAREPGLDLCAQALAEALEDGHVDRLVTGIVVGRDGACQVIGHRALHLLALEGREAEHFVGDLDALQHLRQRIRGSGGDDEVF
ncbi:hypothetical protein D3C71_1718190 [compost metagenome]